MIAERTQPFAPINGGAPAPASSSTVAETQPPRPGAFAAALTSLRRAGLAIIARCDRSDDVPALAGAGDAEIERLTRRRRPTADEARWDMALHHHDGVRRWYRPFLAAGIGLRRRRRHPPRITLLARC